jgi:hypothetical protein
MCRATTQTAQTLTLLANSPKRPMGTILEHNRGHWV